MVMSTDTDNEAQEQEQEVQPEIEINDAGDVGDVNEAPDEQEAEEAQRPPLTGDAPEEPAPAESPEELPTLDSLGPSVNQQEQQVAELQRLRQANVQKEWEKTHIQRAQSIERRAQENGSDPQSARQMARQYLSHQKDIRDQEGKALDVLGFMEGRNNAAEYYAAKYKLLPKQVMEDLAALRKTRTPQETEMEARRISQFRSQKAEIAALKQGRVPSQTFDNSQGSAEVTSNQERLAERYARGDRSSEAVEAARKLTFGS
jgi:hypothetical protein